MGVEEKALDLIGLAYDAALAPEKWHVFMERFADALQARSAMLREVDYDAGDVRLFETVGYDPEWVTAYREHFIHLDYFASTFTNMPIGALILGDQAVPWEQQRETEFCNDYLLPQEKRYVMGSTLARDDRYSLQFGLQRELGHDDYGEEDRQLIRLVAPHMVRAVQIRHRMAEATTEKRWALSALDRLRVGVILLDERGRSLHMNRAAERMTGGRSGFGVGLNGLTLASTAETSRLRRLIADAAALAAGRDNGSLGGGCMRVACNDTALQFQVIPLPRGLSERPLEHSLPRGCVAVFVSTSGGPRLPWQRIAAMHGLTRAEARLASLLADGVSVDQAAEALSVSVQTARSQLKAIFAKTGVTRQAELVALLLADMLNHQAEAAP